MVHDWESFRESLTTLLKVSGDSGDTGDSAAKRLKSPALSVTTRRADVSPLDLRLVTRVRTSGDAYFVEKQSLREGVTTVTSVTTHFEERAIASEAALGCMHRAHVPSVWIGGFQRLESGVAIAGFGELRWQRLIEDGRTFLIDWGSRAAELGWRAEDIFGVHPAAPANRLDVIGLVPLIDGRRVSALSERAATMATSHGAQLTYLRHGRSGAVCLWDLLP